MNPFRQLWLRFCRSLDPFEHLRGIIRSLEREIKIERELRDSAYLASDAAVQSHDDTRNELDNLHDSYAALMNDKLLLQDRLDGAIRDKDMLWRMTEHALDNERQSLRMQVNHAVQKSGGGIPYPDAHSLPVNAVTAPQQPGPVGRRGRQLTSQMIDEQNREFIRQEIERRRAAQQQQHSSE